MQRDNGRGERVRAHPVRGVFFEVGKLLLRKEELHRNSIILHPEKVALRPVVMSFPLIHIPVGLYKKLIEGAGICRVVTGHPDAR